MENAERAFFRNRVQSVGLGEPHRSRLGFIRAAPTIRIGWTVDFGLLGSVFEPESRRTNNWKSAKCGKIDLCRASGNFYLLSAAECDKVAVCRPKRVPLLLCNRVTKAVLRRFHSG